MPKLQVPAERLVPIFVQEEDQLEPQTEEAEPSPALMEPDFE